MENQAGKWKAPHETFGGASEVWMELWAYYRERFDSHWPFGHPSYRSLYQLGLMVVVGGCWRQKESRRRLQLQLHEFAHPWRFLVAKCQMPTHSTGQWSVEVVVASYEADWALWDAWMRNSVVDRTSAAGEEVGDYAVAVVGGAGPAASFASSFG